MAAGSELTIFGVTFEPPVAIGAAAPHDGCQGFDAEHLVCGGFCSSDGAKSWQPCPADAICATVAASLPGALAAAAAAALRVALPAAAACVTVASVGVGVSR